MHIKNIAVFCGASAGNKSNYTEAAIEFAQALIKQDITLIYGGATVGLMGVIADYMLKHQGKVIGVMPQSLVDVELAHPGLTKLHIVQSMSERKELIAALADAFVMLPGGAGSLDEFFEMFTLAQLGYHTKPCAIFNCNAYFDLLLQFLEHTVNEGFLKANFLQMIVLEANPTTLLQKIETYEPPLKSRWK